MALLDPPLQMWPIDTADPQSVIGSDWLRWFQRIYTQVNQQPQQIGSTTAVTKQNASVTAQTLAIPQLESGPARINYYLEIASTDGAGCNIQVQVGWTHNGKSLSRSFPPLTDDTTQATASSSIPVVVDQASPITYSIAYQSTGSTLYDFSIWVNQP